MTKLARPLPFRTPVGVALLLVAATACGGGESASERLAESIIEEGISASGEDVDVDIDFDASGGFSADIGDGQMAMGDDLPRPDWLPNGLPLPDGLAIKASAVDPEVETDVLWGDVDSTGPQVRDAHVGALTAWGAQLIGDPAAVAERDTITFALPDGRVLETSYYDTGEGRTQFTLEIAVRDLEQVEFEASGPKVGPGVATATIDGDTFEAAGQCEMGPGFASFIPEFQPGDDEVSISVSEAGPVNLTNATVGRSDFETGEVVIWVLAATEANVSQGTFDAGSISVEGEFTDLMNFDTGAVNGRIDVRCD
jgi:hypothetical protein